MLNLWANFCTLETPRRDQNAAFVGLAAHNELSQLQLLCKGICDRLDGASANWEMDVIY